MIISGKDSVEIEKLLPGDTIILERVSKEMSKSLFEYAEKIGCKLIFLQYGKFYLKDQRYLNRIIAIDELLK